MEKGYYDDSVQVELHHGIDVSEDYQHEQVIVVRKTTRPIYVLLVNWRQCAAF